MSEFEDKLDAGLEKVKTKVGMLPKAVLIIVGVAVVAFALVMSGAFGS